ADVSRANERQADAFALRVLRQDQQIPMGAILYFQMTAFTASPGRFDYPTVEAWQDALRRAIPPPNSHRGCGWAEGLLRGADGYGANREIARDVAAKLKVIAIGMDDADLQAYFRRIGERAPLSSLRPRKR